VWAAPGPCKIRADEEKLPAAAKSVPPQIIHAARGLALPSVGRQGRTPLHVDALAAQLVAGTWSRPASKH